ncbi:MAG: RCC1 domain-containing protein [Actinomycetes bacterium]
MGPCGAGVANFYGQLGDGTLIDRSVPVRVLNLTGVRQVSAGSLDSCAVRSNGTAWCWGLGESGQLGDGKSMSSSKPVRVAHLTGAVQVAAAYYATCARRSDGGVRCWGSGGQGVLGDGRQDVHLFPVAVKGLPGPVTQLQAGPFNVCALRTDRSVWCWGDNQVGEIGDGTTVNRLVATRTLMTPSFGVKVGFYYTCARTQVRTVKCWGYDNYGQLGNGVITLDSLTPVAVVDLADVASLTLGYSHACAVLRDGTMRCWGWNAWGQLGNGTTQDSSVPVPVLT